MPSWTRCQPTCGHGSYGLRRCIEAVGLPHVREPHVKHVRGPIWEIRLTGKSGIARALYITAIGSRAVVVRVFVKKTQKTPSSEIALALARAKELDT